MDTNFHRQLINEIIEPSRRVIAVRCSEAHLEIPPTLGPTPPWELGNPSLVPGDPILGLHKGWFFGNPNLGCF